MELKNRKIHIQNGYLLKVGILRRLKRIDQLSSLLRLDPFRLNYHLNKPIYFTFQIPKKKGDFRKIQSPNEELKMMQQKLNRYLQAFYFEIKPASVHGFVINPLGVESAYGILSNAKAHICKKHILNLDIQDFFSSISAKQVKTALLKEPFNFCEESANLIALLGTYQKKLPTGAATSPVLSNIACYDLDKELEVFAIGHSLTYTRYVDDLTFSSNTRLPDEVVTKLRELISRHGFALNEKKTRLLSNKSKQTVTGLVVNQKVNVDRKYIRRLRAMLRSWEILGVEIAAAKHFNATKLSMEDAQKFVRKLAGQIQFVGLIRGIEDEIYRKFVLAFEHNMSLE